MLRNANQVIHLPPPTSRIGVRVESGFIARFAPTKPNIRETLRTRVTTIIMARTALVESCQKKFSFILPSIQLEKRRKSLRRNI